MNDKREEPEDAGELQLESRRAEKLQLEQRHFNEKFTELDAEREKVARRLSRLRDATLGVLKRRERVPQPFFWSLFHAELSEIKKRKDEERRARLALLKVDV